MGIFDMFTSQPAAPAQQQQQAAPTAQPTMTPIVQDAGNLQDPNAVAQQHQVPGGVPVAPASDPANAGAADTPLGEFSTLWDNVPTKDSDPTLVAKPLDPTEIGNLVAKQDFSHMVTPEMLASIPADQHDAYKASMNMVAQQVMTQSTLVNNKLQAQAIEQAERRFAAQLPELLREQAVTNHASETNPLLNNPAIKPVVEATRSQLLQKFPDATQAQITEMTTNYITQMGAAFAPAPVVSTAEKEQDFSNYLDKGTLG